MKKVYDNVDFNFPSCGGYEIYKNKDSWSVRKYSNYQGQWTNRYWRVPQAIKKTIEGVLELIRSPYGDEYVTRKGFKVQ